MPITKAFSIFARWYILWITSFSVSFIGYEQCNELPHSSIIQLEHMNMKYDQYNRRESRGINPVLSHIIEDMLEKNLCHAITLTGITFGLEEVQAWHRVKRKDANVENRSIILFPAANTFKIKTLMHLGYSFLNEKKYVLGIPSIVVKVSSTEECP